MTTPARGMAAARWSTAARLIDAVRDRPGITRAEATEVLGISSGTAADLLGRMRTLELISEQSASTGQRGRPTTILQPHPQGPLVVAAELGGAGWRVALAGIDSEPRVEVQADELRSGPEQVVADLADVIGSVGATVGSRVRAVSISVAGTVSDDMLVQFTTSGWRDVDLSPVIAGFPTHGDDVPMLIGNDATLAGLAEARSGAGRGVGTVLHVIVAVGVGGALILDGVPALGAHGSAGEYGHIPFGTPGQQCPCGAEGCWDLVVGGHALAAHHGDPVPRDPVGYALELARRPADARSRVAFEKVAEVFGRGIGGLVNLHDPDVVTLGGLGPLLRASAAESFDTAYVSGLMSFRKSAPPPVLDAHYADDGPLRGAAVRGVDHATSVEALARWADR
ncbi:ROK family transcriptional regulator [Gordonia sp. VNQ95]|uniref:ROK family transcriptional regulator n=1 Tax=Gordonia sp. VNQ95 TaxID=3156619 RepID=UPI0032B59324